jgi:hypothetical protein
MILFIFIFIFIFKNQYQTKMDSIERKDSLLVDIELYKKLLIKFLLKTFGKDIVLFGSTALQLGIENYTIEKNKHLSSDSIKNEIERDIDLIFLFRDYGKVITTLLDKGVIISSSDVNSTYSCSNQNLKNKGISRICQVYLNFGKTSNDIAVQMILAKYKIKTFSFKFDLVFMTSYRDLSLSKILAKRSKNWSIHCSMRNVYCYLDGDLGNLVFGKLKKKNLHIKIKSKSITVNWIIESLKYILWKENRYLLYDEQITHENDKTAYGFNTSQILNSAIFTKKNCEYMDIPYDLLKNFIEFTEFKNLKNLNLDGYCVICQENLDNSGIYSTIASLKCGCMFHTTCIISMLLPFLKDYMRQISKCEMINNSNNDIRQPTVYQLLPGGPIGLHCPNCRGQLFNRKFGEAVHSDFPDLGSDHIMLFPNK